MSATSNKPAKPFTYIPPTVIVHRPFFTPHPIARLTKFRDPFIAIGTPTRPDIFAMFMPRALKEE